jgi:hypothetical protein
VEENNTKEDGKVIEEEEDDDMAVNIDLDFGVNPTSGFSISSPQAPAAESSTGIPGPQVITLSKRQLQ